MTDPLAAVITAQQPLDNGMRIGTVDSVRPLVVLIGGAPAPVGKLSSYQPLVGDVVALMRQDSTWLALGAIDPDDFTGLRGGVIGTNVATVTGLQANSTVIGTEVAFASASWNVAQADYTFLPGQVYELSTQYSPITSGAGASSGNIKVRKGQATITGAVLMLDYIQMPAGFATVGRSQWSRQIIVNLTSAAITTKLSLTAVLSAGAGSLGIYGGDGNAPTLIQVEHKGAYAQQPGLAAGSFASIT